MALDGQVTVNLGGVSAAMTWVANTVSDLNAIFERELCIHLELVPNNDILIFPDPNTDPYSGNGLDYWLEENRFYLNEAIGTNNYDIGHVINPTSGGVAYVGVTCSNNFKGGGTSSTDLKTIAHELGHQFGAGHTFNACGGSGTDVGDYEPGAGNTIMSYAGLCGITNMPGGELLQYHASSYQEMVQYYIDYGHICGSDLVTGNDPPIITMPSSGFTIPISTPFTLKGSVTDDDENDVLSYTWDQYDQGNIENLPQHPEGSAPIFRTYPHSAVPERTFPEMVKIINGTNDVGEILPTYSRDLNFRLMAYDNNPGAGGIDYGELMFHVDENAGPFVVSNPNASNTLWSPGQVRTVEWDIANTDIAPVNCATVNILISFDGGYTFSDTLATNVPNDGEQDIIVPANSGTQNRIKVEAADNIFFDISDEDFEIVPPDAYDFLLEVNPTTQVICTGNSATFQIDLFALGSFDSGADLVLSGLPSGVTSDLPNAIAGPSTIILTIGNLNQLANGHYPMTLTATENGGSIVRSKNFSLVKPEIAATTPGNAMSFDGDDHIQIPQVGEDYEFGTEHDFSVECWIKTTTSSNNAAIVANKDYSIWQNDGWVISIRSGKIHFITGDGDDRITARYTTANYNDGDWHHIAGTFSRTEHDVARLYIDGHLVDEVSVLSLEDISTAVPISIGADSNNDYAYDGLIDEVRVWRKKAYC